MNCVPGMVTQFAFVPSITTEEYRAIPKIAEKVTHINELRAKKSIALTADGQVALDPYEFDFLLLCNKICGASHYNMQMKITVVSPEDYKAWLAAKPTMSQEKQAAAAADAPAAVPAPSTDSTMVEAPIVVLAN